ncbi:MAG: M15 family metallopeptidase [Elusimicrobia bacterium]|nr:M15 family metallopeptidase [Elusimicrobiota bacterium]
MNRAAGALTALALLACAAGRAPARGSLVDVSEALPGVALDIRYATPDNFAKAAVYPAARCLLRPEAAAALKAVRSDLAAKGLTLKLWDCYRPLSVQRRFWELVPDPRYVADPKKGSRHNRGAAVDATLAGVEMPTGYDDFSANAHRATLGGTPAARANAKSLEDAMAARGFKGLPTEWWHFDFAGWERFPLLDEPLTP